jgi:hypothetical protein
MKKTSLNKVKSEIEHCLKEILESEKILEKAFKEENEFLIKRSFLKGAYLIRKCSKLLEIKSKLEHIQPCHN